MTKAQYSDDIFRLVVHVMNAKPNPSIYDYNLWFTICLKIVYIHWAKEENDYISAEMFTLGRYQYLISKPILANIHSCGDIIMQTTLNSFTIILWVSVLL